MKRVVSKQNYASKPNLHMQTINKNFLFVYLLVAGIHLYHVLNHNYNRKETKEEDRS